MNKMQQTARVGLFFILGLALVWVTFETLNDGKVLKNHGYTLVAGFDNLKELKAGDEVRLAGVKIGDVEQTRLAGRRAEAVLRIEPSYHIASDATASIMMSGLIGTNYVGIDLGSAGAPTLAPGAEIHTRVTPDINSIMSDLGGLGQKLEGALGSLGSAMGGSNGQPGLFQKIDRLITDNNDRFGATMTNLQAITGKLNDGQGTLGKLINDPQLHNELVATITEIRGAAVNAKDFMAQAQAIVDQVKSGKGTLGALVFDDATGNQIKATVANLHAVSDKIARGEGSLGKLINDDSLFRDAQGTLKKADRALESLGDSGPITAVGVVANSLF